MSKTLAEWIRGQPRGAMAALQRKTGLSYVTIDRAKRGLLVQADTAKLLSRATRGEVSVRDIPQVKRGKHRVAEQPEDGAESEPRAVA